MSNSFKGFSLRASYGLMINALAAEQDFFVAACDTSTSAGLERFRSQKSERYFEFGISEQAAMSASAAFTLQGHKLFLSSFAPFITYRCAEQIKVSVSYDNAPLCIVGIASGLVQSHLGGTHCSIGENALLKSMEIHDIFTPSNHLELQEILNSYLLKPRKMYVRLLGDTNIYNDAQEKIAPFFYEISKGRDIAIVFTGSLLFQSKNVTSALNKRGISPSIYSLSSLGEENTMQVRERLHEYRKIIFVEEHVEIGSLFSHISSPNSKSSISFVGIDAAKVQYGGSYEEVLKCTLLDSEGITNRILDLYQNLH